MGFKVYLCRKNDPESKGKIEAVIKYAKNNYAKHRLFDNLTAFNQGCIEWLHRTANASIHGTTKKVPVQVFGEEQIHLRPMPSIINIAEDIVTRQVRKDNTIWYRSNRYTLPLGSYHPQKEVVIREEGNTLVISDLETGQELARHQISLDKGKLIKNNNHKRDHLAKKKPNSIKTPGKLWVKEKKPASCWTTYAGKSPATSGTNISSSPGQQQAMNKTY